jgi:hypothetical protein
VLLAVAPAAAASAGWGRPFELVKPGTLDYLPTQLAFSASGAAAAGLAIGDVDAPGSMQAYLVSRSAHGAVSAPHKIAGASEVLALGYARSALELLVGTTPSTLDCCSGAQALKISPSGAVQRRQTLVSGLTGATLGQLVPLADGRVMAGVADERGVWTTQSSRSGTFAAKRRLTGASQSPESLSATWLGGENSLVAWTAASGPAGSANPRSIFYSLGTKGGGPRHAHSLLQVAAGHRIDQLAVARRGSTATAAWIESYSDRRGDYHSQVRAADFSSHPGARTISAGNDQAVGLSLASDAAGAQAIAWEACTSGGACTVRAATRGPNGRFGHGALLGSIDASQTPAVAVGPEGQVVVGWVRGGHPVAAVGSAASGRFGAVHVLSETTFALDLTVAFGPQRNALAAWTQGTLNPSVVAADYRAP